MKKILLSAAAFAVVAVSSIAVAPTTSEAIPAFARQTSAACLSCHFQTFPAINSFGRAFKMGSFTDVGDEALVEDENLSIPAVLNATVVIRGDMTYTNGVGASQTAWNVPSETPILIAGRIGTNSGAFIEFANGGAGLTTSTVSVGNWQFLNSFDVGDFKVGLSGHNSGFGGSAIMEISNVFGQHAGKNSGKGLSAIHNLGFDQGTIGVGTWIGSDLGVLQFSLVAPSAAQGSNVGTKFGKLVRGVLTTEVGGFDTLIGFGFVTGKAGKPLAIGGPGEFDMNLQFVDVQMQGDLGDMSVGIYADWAHAKGKTSASGFSNFYGANFGAAVAPARASGAKSDAFSIRADLKPIDNVIIGAGYGYVKNTPLLGAGLTKTQYQVAATYEVYQNFELIGTYNVTKDKIAGGVTAQNVKTTILEFEALM